ncbi:DUF2834 domain-containing protein [Leptospira sp. WS58.C1]|uniref:DUF2834 domain-containing protein n=1 Tax=Leptospira TaxID=171 RepID=UPI0002BF5988|nr:MULTISPECIES: DUF2834 domain-containing protein [unclassified Leptospira]EMJ97855.1 PF11196 family protein [Leptospira sp. B5-022]MCR1795307.1 DUF2834 domain-containing protein [Leptospira sp. id769339]
MNLSTFRILLILLGSLFTAGFLYLVLPPLSQNFDIIGAFLGGFVNPFSSAYALDIIFTWLVLAVWIVYEAKTKGIKNGWIALLLGVVPGVAVGAAYYIYLRAKQDRN